MGVTGLSTFVSSRDEFTEKKHLRDTKLVIDGFNLLHDIYYNSNADTAYGGDYDVFAKTVENYLYKLRSANVVGYFVFDGALEPGNKKLHTVLSRTEKRIQLATWSRFNKRAKILPILAYKVFVSKLHEHGAYHCVCDFEADAQLASIANQLGCPILSSDSDFLLMPLEEGVIRIEDFNVHRLVSKEEDGECVRYLSVKIYNYKNVLKKYRFTSVKCLPLLSVLCGNDVFPPSKLEACRLRCIKSPKRENKFITYLNWLSSQTSVEEAIDAILDSCDDKLKRSLKNEIRDCLCGYAVVENHILPFLQNGSICHNENNHFVYNILPASFWKSYRRGEKSADFLNVIVFNRVILSCQMESMVEPSAWICSRRIRLVTYGILSLSTNTLLNVTEYDRKKRALTNHKYSPTCNLDGKSVPTLKEIATFSDSDKEKFLYSVLETSEVDYSSIHTGSWSEGNMVHFERLLSIVIHWINHAEPKVLDLHIMSLLVGMIKMFFVDRLPIETQIRQSVRKYWHVPDRDQKHEDGIDIRAVHGFAQFQATLHDTLNLMNLLDLDFELPLERVYSGRYSYNFMLKLMERPDPLLYCQEILMKGSVYSQTFYTWFTCVLTNCQSDRVIKWSPRIVMNKPSKKRKREKRKSVAPVAPESVRDNSNSDSSKSESDSDTGNLGSNKYAALAMN